MGLVGGVWLGIVVSAIFLQILGALWYSPLLFGNAWMKLSGMTKRDIDKAKKKGMGKLYFINFIAALIGAYVLSVILDIGGINDVVGGLAVGFLVWLGFIATVMVGTVLWDGKPIKLYLINAGFYLVGYPVAGAILGAWI